MSAERRILLVRHGHRTDDGDVPSSGLGLPPLSPLGHRQATAFAASLDDTPDLIVVSTFLRAIQTAEPIRARFPTAPVETWPVEEFTFLPPSLFIGTTFRDREPQNSAYWRAADPDLHPGPGGESFREFIARVDRVLARLLAHPARFIVVVTHGYTIQALLWRLAHPGRATDASGMAAWNVFRAPLSLAPTASVELRGPAGGPFVSGPILPPRYDSSSPAASGAVRA